MGKVNSSKNSNNNNNNPQRLSMIVSLRWPSIHEILSQQLRLTKSQAEAASNNNHAISRMRGLAWDFALWVSVFWAVVAAVVPSQACFQAYMSLWLWIYFFFSNFISCLGFLWKYIFAISGASRLQANDQCIWRDTYGFFLSSHCTRAQEQLKIPGSVQEL